VPGIGWSPEILDLISKLKPGQISEPVNLDKNYYLFRLKETKVAYVPEFNQIKDKIKEAFLKDRAKKIAGEKIQECLKKLKEFYKENSKVADFTKTAKQFGLKTDATANFKYASYIEGIGSTDNFWLAAQDLKEDDFSEAIEMPSGYYIIRLKSKAPLDEKLFPQKKPEYEKQLLSQKKQQYFSQYLEQLKKGASLP
jgi:parvulin-like peptidyl-prolyl isomerase